MIRRSKTPGAVRRRPGITMIETLILITCVGAVLGIAAITIQAMLRLSADSQVRLSRSLVFERLASQLRSDAHSSETAQLVPRMVRPPRERPSSSSGRQPGREVTYKVLEKSVDRDETAAGKKTRHESFMLPRGQLARFALGDEAGRVLVLLTVKPDPASKLGGSDHGLEVLALVGKHRGVPRAKSEGPKK